MIAFAFVLALFAESLSAATSASKLEWRNNDTTATRHVLAVGSTAVRVTGGQPVAAASVTQTNSLRSASTQQYNSLRPTRRRVDSFVRPAAFEDGGGPQFGKNAGSDSQVRSVVVDRNDAESAFRSAQRPSPGAPTGASDTPGAPGATDAGAQPGDDFRDPLNDMSSELPPLDEPPMQGLETPPLPDDTRTQPDIEQRQPLQPQQRQPSTEFQPRAPLPGETSRPLPAEAPPVSEEVLETERQKSQKACSDGFDDLREKTIDKLNLSIAVTGEQGSDYPFECTLDDSLHGGRCWEQTTYQWKASALCHKPLYFEDEQLERYGHSFSPCFQPFVSGAHFFTRLPILPYCMGVEPPTECIYALGHYRPGNCAPYMCNPFPLSPRGAVFQAGAVYGAAAVLP